LAAVFLWLPQQVTYLDLDSGLAPSAERQKKKEDKQKMDTIKTL
jgi:hypothetical protein